MVFSLQDLVQLIVAFGSMAGVAALRGLRDDHDWARVENAEVVNALPMT